MNEEAKKKYIQFKMIEEQITDLSSKMEMLEKQQSELANTRKALNELPNTPNGREILIPLAAGIFAKAKLEKNDKVFVNVGSNVTVGKTPEQALIMVQEQMDQIAEYEKELTAGLMKLSGMADTVNEELMSIQEKEQ
jgi:prefoldin alpha subunit